MREITADELCRRINREMPRMVADVFNGYPNMECYLGLDQGGFAVFVVPEELANEIEALIDSRRNTLSERWLPLDDPTSRPPSDN